MLPTSAPKIFYPRSWSSQDCLHHLELLNDRTNSSLSPQARKAAEAQAAVQNGSAITLLERLTNERSQTATNVVVSGSLPQGAQVTGCDTGSGGGSCIMQGNNVSARYPTFGPGQTATIN
jgi:hypothetical protein